MKRILLTLGLLLAAVRALAVNPEPYTLGVSFSAKVTGSSICTLTVYAEPGDALSTDTTQTESSIKNAWLRPGKQYTFNFSFTAFAASNYYVSFIAPDGYALYVNGLPMDMVQGSQSSGNTSQDYTIQLRPVVTNTREDVAVFSGINIGKSIGWDFGLGGLRSGHTVGRVGFREQDLTNSPASRDRLIYVAPVNTFQVSVVRDGASAQTVRQIYCPQAAVDFVDDAGGGYWMKFYAPSQAAWNGTLYTFTGSPWRTVRVTSTIANRLTINETEGSVSRVSQLDAPVNIQTAPTGGTITTSGSYTIHTFTTGGTFTVNGGISSVETLVVAGGGGGGAGVSGVLNGGGGGAGGLLCANYQIMDIGET